MDRWRRNSSPINEARIMNKATITLIAAVAALTLSGGIYAQSNDMVATSTTVSLANATSGYGTPGVTNSESGKTAVPRNWGLPNSAKSLTNVPGSHNTLATPSTASPAAQ
jgi:hypothetical protein